MVEKPPPKKGGKPRSSLATRAKDEPDPAWRAWFLEVDNRRKAVCDSAKKNVIVSTYEKDGQEYRIARPQSDPLPVKKFITRATKKTGSAITQDLLWIRNAWPGLVGPELAAESSVYAFKNGVLTISVFSSPLLQEIRQFLADSLLKDLRDIWQASIPLVKITYRLDKK
jgi:hypothetical protein